MLLKSGQALAGRGKLMLRTLVRVLLRSRLLDGLLLLLLLLLEQLGQPAAETMDQHLVGRLPQEIQMVL